MGKTEILGLLRQALTMVGPVLLANGIGDEAVVQQVTGAAIALVGLIWGVVDKSGELVPSILSITRHTTGAVGAILLATDVFPAGQIESGAGLVMAAVAFGTSFINKRNRRKNQ